jgi:hypothetical protein
MSDFWTEFFVPSLSEGEQNRSLHRLRREVAALGSRLSSERKDGQAARGDLRQELDALQYNFARTLLLVHALTTTLLRKNVITKVELQAIIQELDLLDGQADQAIAPEALPGLRQKPEPRSTETTLEKLAQQMAENRPSPRDFLKELEEG